MVSYGGDYLFTYGIGSCCGIVLYDEEKYILFHLDRRNLPEEVKQKTDLLNLNSNSKVLICPGVTCSISGTFKHEDLEKLYSDEGYDTTVCRINGALGYIKVDKNNIRVGSLLFKENEITISKKATHKR